MKLLGACRDEYEKLIKRKKRRPYEKKQTFKPPAFLFPLMLVATRTGLRRGNLVGPKAIVWGDIVNLDQPGKEELRIDAARMKNKADLAVPLHPEAGEVLRWWRANCGRVPHDRAPVFEVERTNTKKPVPPKKHPLQQFHRAFRSAIKRAGLDKKPMRVRFHDAGRHTFESLFNLANPGCASERMRLVGHKGSKDSNSTRVDERYVHMTIEELRPFLSRMPHFFPGEFGKEVGKKAASSG